MTSKQFESLGLKDFDLIILMDGNSDSRTGMVISYNKGSSYFLFQDSNKEDIETIFFVEVVDIIKV